MRRKTHLSTFYHLFRQIFALSLALCLISTPSAFATVSTASSSVNTTIINPAYTLPPLSDFEAALSKIESFPNYQTYYNANPGALDQLTPFPKEYQYLFNLADASHALLLNYEHADPREATVLLSAMKDAAIACDLLFGIQAEKYQASHPAPSPDTNSPSTPSTTMQTSSSTKPHTSITLTSSNNTNTTTAPSTIDSEPTQPDTPITPESQLGDSTTDDIPVPATGTVSEESVSSFHFLPYLLAAACAIAAIIGLLAVSSRRRPYRPGRKIR